MYLFGASGHGKVVAEAAEASGLEIKGFIDDNPDLKNIWEYPVLRTMPENTDKLFLSVGNNFTRKKMAEKYSNLNFETIIHTSTAISLRAQIGNGSVVMAGVSVNADVKIGQHCILNTNSSIDHDCQIEDFVHISPNAALAGNVKVGEGSQIGIGASVIQGVKIGKWAMIGAGAVVIKDVPDFAVVVGNPGKIIKYKDSAEN
ncbi:MAG: acetyltransferase [Flavobacteriaceae bacterium]|jgi:acetyltransferase EpsM|nr:acetyltransferase [Flavobacteriaceae bacterium]